MTQPRVERFFLPVLGGILLGVFVLFIFQLPMKFTYYLIAGPVILFIAIMSGRFQRFFQGMFYFIIPLNYSTHFFRRPYKFGTTTGLDFSPLDIILLILYAVWIYELLLKKREDFHFFPRISIPALCLVGISAFSMLPAVDPYLTLFETVRLFKGLLIALYVANHIRTRREINFVLVLLLGGLLLQSLIAFGQRWLGMSLGLQLFGEYKQMASVFLTGDYYLDVSRVGGTLGHPNNLAKYAELLLPLSFVLVFTGIKPRSKLASGLIFVCAFVVLLLTLSRGGWVCFAGSMVLTFFFIFRARLISTRMLVSLMLVGILLMGVSMGFSGLIGSRLFGDDYGAARGRIPLNKIAYAAIRANPILGVGNFNMWKVQHRYNPNLTEIKAEQMVHNAYLSMAAETGITGLLIFLWFLAAVFLTGYRHLKARDPFMVCLNIGILAGMAALWAHWLVDPAYIGRQVLFWVLVGFLMANRRMFLEERSTFTKREMGRSGEWS